MKEAIEKTLVKENLTNVEVIIYNTLSVDAAIECGADVLIRGLRNSIDYEYSRLRCKIDRVHSVLLYQ
jgi:phosphopantetheine adenylyltransferase